MPQAILLFLLVLAASVLQVAVLPAFVPPVVRPDLLLLTGLCVLLMGPRDWGFVALFALGVAADLFGSARFGLLTVSYLLAGGGLWLVLGREMGRGDVLGGAFACLLGTLFAHGSYVLLARPLGWGVSWAQAGATLAGLLIGAAVFALPMLYISGRFFYRLGWMPDEARERWLAGEKLAQARRRSAKRA